MKITKVTKKTYDINFYPNAIKFTFGEFEQSRKKHRLSVSKFEKCFICGHEFADEETPIMVTVGRLGNRMACKECCVKGEM